MIFTIIARFLMMGALVLMSTSVFAEDVDPVIRAKAEICMSCHGANGYSTNEKYPSLAGQSTTYLYLQLKDFMKGKRSNPEMTPMAATIKDKAEALQLAIFFGSLPQFQYDTTTESAFKIDPVKVEQGRIIAEKTICTMCHGDAFKGMGDVPRVQGQQPVYVLAQLKNFRDGVRTNDGGTMKSALGPLTDDEMENLVHFIASQ